MNEADRAMLAKLDELAAVIPGRPFIVVTCDNLADIAKGGDRLAVTVTSKLHPAIAEAMLDAALAVTRADKAAFAAKGPEALRC